MSASLLGSLSRRTFCEIDIECDVLMRVREFCMRNILKWSKTSQTLLRGKRYCDWSACHNEMRQHLSARLSDQIVETIPKDSLRSVVMMNGYILAVAVPPTAEAGVQSSICSICPGRSPTVRLVCPLSTVSHFCSKPSINVRVMKHFHKVCSTLQ